MKTVFLDRDGVINENLDNDYVKRWEEYRFLSKSKKAIKTLTDAGWNIIIISNQSGIGRRLMSIQDLEDINARMLEEIESAGGKIQAVYYCPHAPSEGCDCRKPEPGMLFRAAREFGIELPKSYIVGDNITDIQAGARAGCTTILVKTGRGKEILKQRDQWSVSPDYIAEDLYEAVKLLSTLDAT